MEEKDLERKWFNYFSNMRNKYNMRLSGNKPIVLFLDAKDSSKNKRNLLDNNKNGFLDAMGMTAKHFTTKYSCISIFGTDEISFIIDDSDNFIDTINNEKSFRTHDVASIFSQYFFEYFNSVYNGETVYFHCKCFNIAKEKVKSYISFKSKGIQKGVTAFFLKQHGVKKAQGIKLVEKIEMCKSYDDFSSIEEYKDGTAYYQGKKIDIKEYLKGNIVIIKEQKDIEEFFDLINFDNML